MTTTFKQYLKESDQPFMTDHDDIKEWLEEHDIYAYTISKTGEIDVGQNVDLSHKDINYFPVKFRKIHGYFDCSWNNLKSLRGAPDEATVFYCSSNPQLKSYEFMPAKIHIDFCCGGDAITSLADFDWSGIEIGETIFLDSKKIIRGGLGLILIKGNISTIRNTSDYNDVNPLTQPFEIIQRYLGKPNDIFDCQNELIEAGFEEYAQL